MNSPRKSQWPLFASELIGTALLLFFGLSVVINDWGTGSVMGKMIHSDALRRAITGFLFGCTGCLVTISPVGKISGAHINPAVTLAFWLNKKMKTRTMIGYIISQMIGAVLGSIPLLIWGNQGRSVQFGITLPGSAGALLAFIGEIVTTACLILVVFIFVGSKKLRYYTPFTMPFLYGIMVWAESAYSGCSTNPARSLGPAVISHSYGYYWLYCVAPVTSVFLVVWIFRRLRLHEYYQMEAARLSYHKRGHP